MKADRDNHAEIYLQPPGTAEDPDTGRLWCQDDAPFDCEDDDGNVVPWVRYVRSDIHDALAARLADAEASNERLGVIIDAMLVTEENKRVRLAEEQEFSRQQVRLVAAHASDGERLEARLAEAERLLRKIRHEWDGEPEDMQEVGEFLRATDSASAVQPERCCLDYPRCDCNSPPESEGAE